MTAPAMVGSARLRRTFVWFLVVVGLGTAIGGTALPATAGGSWLRPARDRYEPGEQATLVGYTGGGQLGWIDDGPFYGYLRVDPEQAVADLGADPGWPSVAPSDLPLGPLVLQETGLGGYQRLRAAITFEIPADLAAGDYELVLCNDPCTTGLGDFIGGTVWVGVDPTYPITRDWPANDPARMGAPASVALPPPPPTTAPAPPSTTTPPPSTALPSLSTDRRPSPVVVPTSLQRAVVDDEGGDAPAWLLIGGAIAFVAALAALAALRTRPQPRPALSSTDAPGRESPAERPPVTV